MRAGGKKPHTFTPVISFFQSPAMDSLPGIRFHSAAFRQPLLSSTHHQRELLGTSLDPRVSRGERKGGGGWRRVSVKVQQRSIASDIQGDLCCAISEKCKWVKYEINYIRKWGKSFKRRNTLTAAKTLWFYAIDDIFSHIILNPTQQ